MCCTGSHSSQARRCLALEVEQVLAIRDALARMPQFALLAFASTATNKAA